MPPLPVRHITWFLDDSHSILGFFHLDFAGVGCKDVAPFFLFFGVASEASSFVFFGVACVPAEGKSEDVVRVVASEAPLLFLPPFFPTFFFVFFFTTCPSPSSRRRLRVRFIDSMCAITASMSSPGLSSRASIDGELGFGATADGKGSVGSTVGRSDGGANASGCAGDANAGGCAASS